jgi:DNA primase
VNNKEFFTTNQAAFHDEFEKELGLDLHVRLLDNRRKKIDDNALTLRYQKQLASRLGIEELNLRNLRFTKKAQVSMPPKEPDNVLEQLLEIVRKDKSPRANAALTLCSYLLVARVQRRLLNEQNAKDL